MVTSIMTDWKGNLIRKGCNTKVVFKMTIDGKYELVKFYESHNHVLVFTKKEAIFKNQQGK